MIGGIISPLDGMRFRLSAPPREDRARAERRCRHQPGLDRCSFVIGISPP
jgi:hypothetical protein